VRPGWAGAVALAALLSAHPVDAQVKVSPMTIDPGELLMTVGEQARRELRPWDALHAFEEVLSKEPHHYGALWRSARESVALGALSGSDDERKRRFLDAEDRARQAVGVDPQGDEAHLWLAVALGKRATLEGPRTKVRLAVEMRELALRTLELNPHSAGAHHVLGEWHAEIRRLSGVTRWAARKLLGADVFDEASWDDAELHLRRAVELEPGSASHRLALGRLQLDRGRPADAAEHLRRVLESPPTDPEDGLHRASAEELLRGT